MVTWDDATDKKFLLNIIHVVGPEKLNWPTIAASMGEEYTPESVKSRYKKLKQQAKAQFGDPPTPASKGKGMGEKASATGSKRKAKKAVAETEGDEGEDDVEETPSKKMKVKKEVKKEDEGGEMV
ncbi:hypothetical protein M409DRAFT_19091 [Zasmidium cellare ATCC 36951]|uniref:Myb-like domain-containing protein n=1 Tax=Zasmidium cellare ATCC 36951 TaxID=1080233 RepID=A0A6A6CY52_ZASCE|nr:uncharacterized protein M409DRAFT_19091 [Zasmidium cellare ATCC 36951]KAF2171120.1 hypothetical protein M409DRAFT_19091 [Zasmidium cellare ATCC 36951]